MEELFDTFDEEMKWIGTATRREVHRLGLWHQTFHCWVMHRTPDGNYLVLQRRHRNKDTHPNKLDISCAGHLEAGESPADGIRELREELGIEVEFDTLRKVGVFKYSDTSCDVKDNEFCHVFVMIRDNEMLSRYNPAVGELGGLYLIRLDDMKNLCLRRTETALANGYGIDDNGLRLEETILIRFSDMVEYELPYFEMLFSKMGSM